eukprot:1296547-Rhodomonas_salina.1
MEHSQGENSPDWEDFEISLAEWESESFTAVPFTLVDLDASGKVTWDPEFLAFMDAYVQERVRVIEADTNKDGKLDPEEWAALSAADSTIPALSFFDGVVENVQDGSVNTDELVYAIIKANQLLEEDFTYEGEEEADPCISPPAWCPGSLPGLTLGSCRPFQSTTLTGDRTCNPAARWQGGIISESQNAKNTIFNLFAKAGAETLTSADVATISEQISGVAGGFATGLGSTFADIDAKGDAVVSRDELYKYLLRGGDRAGRWFTALFDKDCNGMFQPEEARSFCMYSPCEKEMPIFGTYEALQMTSNDAPVFCPYVRSVPQIAAARLWPYLGAMKNVAERNTDPPVSTTSPLQAINLG